MPETYAVLNALPHDRQTARIRVTEHGLSETTNDVPSIMATVSHWDQHFALLTEAPDGVVSLRLEVDRAGVQTFYEDRVATELIEKAHSLTKVQTPWYGLTHSIGDVYRLATQERGHTHVAVIFPTWTDGIIGEVMWAPQVTDPISDWRVEARIGDQLDAFDAAWRAGDADGMVALVGDTAFGVIRVVQVAGERRDRFVARSKDELRASWSQPSLGTIEDVQVTGRVIHQSYAFTSYRLLARTPSGRVEREVARILPVDRDGRFIGELSYAFEVDLP